MKLVDNETAQKFFEGEHVDGLEPFFTYLTPEEEHEKAQTFCNFLMRTKAQCTDSTIAVTYDCNLQCPYCYEIWAKNPNMKMAMDKYKVDKAFEALEHLNTSCTSKKPLTLTGGEPLMKKNKEIVKYILKKGTNLGYTFAIFTNGVELHHFLNDFSGIDIDYIQVTLDGPRSLHNERRVFNKGNPTFDTIVSNIEKARKLELPLVIRTNTDPEILDRIDELAAFFKKRGWDHDPHIMFSLVYVCDQRLNPDAVEQQLKVYQEIVTAATRADLQFLEVAPFVKLGSLWTNHPRFWPSFWNCKAVVNRYVFDPFGDVYPCRAMLGWKEERIGVYTPELQFNEKLQKWRKRTIFNMGKCTECDVALVCGGSCGYASLLNKKDLFTPVCQDIEKIVVPYLEYKYKGGIHMLPKVHSQVLIREEPDETYVIHMGTGKMYKFNQTAIAMLKACQEGITKSELIQRL
ncbi:MAG: SPASM domain-containing protein, partial [Candidatus Methanofastidiosia archaeon]